MAPMRSFTVMIGIACAALACESGGVQSAAGSAEVPATSASANAKAAAGAPGATDGTFYGAPFEPGPEVKLSTLLANPAAYANQTVVTEGKVQRACSRKGCWMEIAEGDGSCRVTFKDYAFFVPKDSAGAYARLQGRVETREVEPAAIEHLESEGARFQNKRADGTATEVRLIASAVELRR